MPTVTIPFEGKPLGFELPGQKPIAGAGPQPFHPGRRPGCGDRGGPVRPDRSAADRRLGSGIRSRPDRERRQHAFHPGRPPDPALAAAAEPGRSPRPPHRLHHGARNASLHDRRGNGGQGRPRGFRPYPGFQPRVAGGRKPGRPRLLGLRYSAAGEPCGHRGRRRNRAGRDRPAPHPRLLRAHPRSSSRAFAARAPRPRPTCSRARAAGIRCSGSRTTRFAATWTTWPSRVGMRTILNVVMDSGGPGDRHLPRRAPAAFTRGVEAARRIYGVEYSETPDIVVANSYPCDLDFWQSHKSQYPAQRMVKPGGTIVVCTPGAGGGEPGAHRSAVVHVLAVGRDQGRLPGRAPEERGRIGAGHRLGDGARKGLGHHLFAGHPEAAQGKTRATPTPPACSGRWRGAAAAGRRHAGSHAGSVRSLTETPIWSAALRAIGSCGSRIHSR